MRRKKKERRKCVFFSRERRKCVTACVQYGRMGPESMALDRSDGPSEQERKWNSPIPWCTRETKLNKLCRQKPAQAQPCALTLPYVRRCHRPGHPLRPTAYWAAGGHKRTPASLGPENERESQSTQRASLSSPVGEARSQKSGRWSKAPKLIELPIIARFPFRWTPSTVQSGPG
jgi:hypothetical protein